MRKPWRLDEATKANSENGMALNWLFLAMTHQRLGHPDEARKWMKRASKWIDQATEKVPPTGLRLSWDQQLELQIIRREAEVVVQSSN
jgi:hypothetical protein